MPVGVSSSFSGDVGQWKTRNVGVGDIVMTPVEILEARDWLKFAGIAPPAVSLLSKEQQFAEKLHAYTLPDRKTPNSRVKDLVDMLMLIERGDLGLIRVADSIKAARDLGIVSGIRTWCL